MTSKIPISSVHTNDISKESNIGTPNASCRQMAATSIAITNGANHKQ